MICFSNFPALAVAVTKLGITPLLGIISYHFLGDVISMCNNGAVCPYNDAMWLALLVVTASPTSTALVVMASVADESIGEVEGPDGVITTSQAMAGVLRMQYVLTPIALTVSLTCILVAIALRGDPALVPLELMSLASCGS